MPQRPSPDFYEAQEAHRRTSLIVVGILTAYAAAAFTLVFGGIRLILGAVAAWPAGIKPSTVAEVVSLGLLAAASLVGIQYLDSRWNGPRFILKRLDARTLDLRDRKHREAGEAVERMRIAAGLARTEARIIPDHTINALALVESDGTPVIGLTEGLLAGLKQDELEAVAALQTARVVRGDAALVTFVCAIADFFERWAGAKRREAGGDVEVLPLSAVLVRLLGRFVARERVLLADATAVELCRNPAALARALFKAQLKDTFIGDFHESYSPLFMVAAEGDPDEGDRPVWADTHPPLSDRVRVLAGMAHLPPEEIVRDVWAERNRREAGKSIATEAGRPAAAPLPASMPDPGLGRCPRCAASLVRADYEGVPVFSCRSCGGKLVGGNDIDRILIRRETGFDDALVRKAAEFRERFVRNPLKAMKINDRVAPARSCPACGFRLVSRPFNYQYFVPVRKCLDCGSIWFDPNELEILQILVEQASQD